jgi:hypothetical protein
MIQPNGLGLLPQGAGEKIQHMLAVSVRGALVKIFMMGVRHHP